MAFLRTTFLLGILTAIFLAVGWLVGGITGISIGLAAAIATNFLVFFFSDKIVLRMYRAKPLQDAKLSRVIEELAKKAGIPKPKTYMVEMAVPNAFATGRSPKHSAVAVTRGLVDNLSHDEVEGVLAHEISHIKHRDTLVSTMAATIAGALAWMGHIFWYSSDRQNRNAWTFLLIFILVPIAATLIRLAITRTREYHADTGGAQLADPLKLASALEKIGSIAKAHPVRKGNPSTAHMWIVNPFSGASLLRLFSTHPPIEERVARLRAMAKK
jgi:heat shock protein HtpX